MNLRFIEKLVSKTSNFIFCEAEKFIVLVVEFNIFVKIIFWSVNFMFCEAAADAIYAVPEFCPAVQSAVEQLDLKYSQLILFLSQINISNFQANVHNICTETACHFQIISQFFFLRNFIF